MAANSNLPHSNALLSSSQTSNLHSSTAPSISSKGSGRCSNGREVKDGIDLDESILLGSSSSIPLLSMEEKLEAVFVPSVSSPSTPVTKPYARRSLEELRDEISRMKNLTFKIDEMVWAYSSNEARKSGEDEETRKLMEIHQSSTQGIGMQMEEASCPIEDKGTASLGGTLKCSPKEEAMEVANEGKPTSLVSMESSSHACPILKEDHPKNPSPSMHHHIPPQSVHVYYPGNTSSTFDFSPLLETKKL